MCMHLRGFFEFLQVSVHFYAFILFHRFASKHLCGSLALTSKLASKSIYVICRSFISHDGARLAKANPYAADSFVCGLLVDFMVVIAEETQSSCSVLHRMWWLWHQPWFCCWVWSLPMCKDTLMKRPERSLLSQKQRLWMEICCSCYIVMVKEFVQENLRKPGKDFKWDRPWEEAFHSQWCHSTWPVVASLKSQSVNCLLLWVGIS